MNRLDFVKTVVEGTEIDNHPEFERCFYNPVLKRWLKEWAPSKRKRSCSNCNKLDTNMQPVSLTCEEVQKEGHDCYRQVLQTKFVPFVQNALQDECPEPSALKEVLFQQEPVRLGTLTMTLKGIIEHELLGMVHKMFSEGYFENNKPSVAWLTKEVRKSKAKKKG